MANNVLLEVWKLRKESFYLPSSFSFVASKGKSESPPSNSIKDSVKTTVKAQSAAFWQIGAILEESKHSRMLRYICNMHE